MGQLYFLRRIRRKTGCAEKLLTTACAKLLLIFCLGLQGPHTLAQSSFKKLQTIAISGPIVNAAVDRVGELYLVSQNGNVSKMSVDGAIIESAKLEQAPTLFDPRDGSHIFFYWRNSGKYELRLPDLRSISETKVIDSSFAIHPLLACPSADHDLIILDSADWSLKKVDGKTSTVLYETIIFEPGDKARAVTFMREYQNFVFLLHPAGINIYNRMGKLLKTLPGKSIPYFSFLGEEIYYPVEDGLHLFDLFTAEERNIALPGAAAFAFLTDERLYLVNHTRVDIYSLIP
jgi:hypothetical protein